MRTGAVILALTLLVLPALPAAAEIYRWVDDQGNAHFTDGLLNVPERHRRSAVPLGMRSSPPAPSSAPARPTAPSAGAVAAPVARGGALVRYTPGERIVVDVRLNGRSPARLLLDTGADRTLITPRALVAAGAEMTRPVARGEMRGVTGSDQVVYVVLDTIEIGEARVERLPVAAYEMGSRDSDGLLGRDFLDRFNVSIDAARGVVTLQPK
jgi:hypothetical protein